MNLPSGVKGIARLTACRFDGLCNDGLYAKGVVCHQWVEIVELCNQGKEQP